MSTSELINLNNISVNNLIEILFYSFCKMLFLGATRYRVYGSSVIPYNFMWIYSYFKLKCLIKKNRYPRLHNRLCLLQGGPLLLHGQASTFSVSGKRWMTYPVLLIITWLGWDWGKMILDHCLCALQWPYHKAFFPLTFKREYKYGCERFKQAPRDRSWRLQIFRSVLIVCQTQLTMFYQLWKLFP